jgi:hypothetical protein
VWTIEEMAAECCAACGYPDTDDEDEDDFQECAQCDGHPACEDFGCAIKLGLGHLVKQRI